MKLEEQEQTATHDLESAVAHIEGIQQGEPITKAQEIIAWAFLVKTGNHYKMSRHYERTSINLIEKGLINEDGSVDWDIFRELYGKTF